MDAVAEAIYRSNQRMFTSPTPWCELAPRQREGYKINARDAIAALRESPVPAERATENRFHIVYKGELPRDLARVLQDPSIIIRQDAAVFELIAKWQNAPCTTESAPVAAPVPGAEATRTEATDADD